MHYNTLKPQSAETLKGSALPSEATAARALRRATSREDPEVKSCCEKGVFKNRRGFLKTLFCYIKATIIKNVKIEVLRLGGFRVWVSLVLG